MVAEIGRVKLHSEALAAAQKRALRRLGPLMTIQRWVKEFAT